VNAIGEIDHLIAECVSKERKMDFDAVFRDGYTIRHLIEYLKNTNFDGIFEMSKEGIAYEMENSNNTILNMLEIRASDITYYYNAELGDRVEIGLSLAEFSRNTKVGKKDGFRMFRETGEDQISCQHLCTNAQNSGNSDRSYVNPKKVVRELFFIDFPIPENSPNYTISITEFSRVCAKILLFNPSKTMLTVYSKGIKLEAYDSNDRKCKENNFGLDIEPNIVPALGTDSVSDKEPLQSIELKQSTIKAFSKIKNVSPPAGISSN
jgi:hypothetical protein